MKQPTDDAKHQERLAAKLAQIKSELSQRLLHCIEPQRAPTAIALLETAIECFITDLGEDDAALFVQSAFVRVAAQHRIQSDAMRADLAAVAKTDTKGEA
jgi:hypothetical protein